MTATARAAPESRPDGRGLRGDVSAREGSSADGSAANATAGAETECGAADRAALRNPLVRAASPADRSAVNAVVADAVRAWSVADRVLRLALPSLEYGRADLDVMTLWLAESVSGQALGVAACESGGDPVTDRFAPGSASGETVVPRRTRLTLHGLYVRLDAQGTGIGTRLLEAVEAYASDAGFDEVDLRAWRDAEVFFVARGYVPVPESAGAHPRHLYKQLQ